VSARDEVLARIAAAHGAAPPPSLPYEAISRDYRTSSDSSTETLTELLIDRLVDYRALVRRCSADDLAAVIAETLAERSAQTVVAPAGSDPSWTASSSAEVLTDGSSADDQLSVSELDAANGVITGCTVAIAETGTLILDGQTGRDPAADHGQRTECDQRHRAEPGGRRTWAAHTRGDHRGPFDRLRAHGQE
jgi:L-lactate dehydrogenase complex protein LldG